METWITPSVLRNTPQPSQRKYRSTLSSQTPHRQSSPRTLSNESGLPCRMTVQLVRSSISNSAFVLAPTELRRMYRMHIHTKGTMSDDEGISRKNSTIRHDRTWTLISTFFLSLFFQVPYEPHHLFMVPRALLLAPYENLLSDPLKGSHTKVKSSTDVWQSI